MLPSSSVGRKLLIAVTGQVMVLFVIGGTAVGTGISAKKAYKEGRPIKEVAAEMTDLSKKDPDRLLDPRPMTEGGVENK